MEEKNVYTEWVYVLDVHCYIHLSVEVAQQFLLDDDVEYFRWNK